MRRAAIAGIGSLAGAILFWKLAANVRNGGKRTLVDQPGLACSGAGIKSLTA
jgi:hypothetical protein